MSDESRAPGERQDDRDHSGRDVPSVVVHDRARLSVVWLIPLIAAVVALYLAYSAWIETGPTITITFESAEGLVAGQTKLKYKRVDVGLVEKLGIDLETLRLRPYVAEGRVRRLLHHLAQLPGQNQVLLAVHARCLDKQDFAPGRRCRQPRSHPDLPLPFGDLQEERRRTQQILYYGVAGC